MPINPAAELGVWTDWNTRTWSSTDSLVYAVGVGAGANHPAELPFTTENSRGRPQRALPTMAAVLGPSLALTALGPFDKAMLVDGGRTVVLHRELPAEGTIRTRGRLTGIYDKVTGAVVATECEAVDAGTGEPLFELRAEYFIRGAGGFAGDRGPSSPSTTAPDRTPDHAVTYETRPEQALIYRLSGDRNPLHADPAVANAAGFDRPILHGLCTYGFTGRALLHSLCEGDPARFKSMSGRFSGVVFPGDTLTISMWTTAGSARFVTRNQVGKVVIDRGTCTFR